jgi:hypothetical protein
MKEIELTQGFKTQVDDEDFECLNQWKWYACVCAGIHYARRTENKKKIFMHRQILNTPKGTEVDHLDHCGLNNQKSNLRNCTSSQNKMNKSPFGQSKYLGVEIKHTKSPNGEHEHFYYSARICTNYKKQYIGSYKTEESAARAYDEAAKKYHGEFANLNFKTT